MTSEGSQIHLQSLPQTIPPGLFSHRMGYGCKRRNEENQLDLTETNRAFGGGGVDGLAFEDDFDPPLSDKATGGLAGLLHVVAHLLFRDDGLEGFAGTNSRSPGAGGEEREDRLLELLIDLAGLLPSTTGGAESDFVPAALPFFTPLDEAATALTDFGGRHG